VYGPAVGQENKKGRSLTNFQPYKLVKLEADGQGRTLVQFLAQRKRML